MGSVQCRSPTNSRFYADVQKIHPFSPRHCSQSVLFQQYCVFLRFPSCFSEHLCHAQLASCLQQHQCLYLCIHRHNLQFLKSKIGLFPAFFGFSCLFYWGCRAACWAASDPLTAGGCCRRSCVNSCHLLADQSFANAKNFFSTFQRKFLL